MSLAKLSSSVGQIEFAVVNYQLGFSSETQSAQFAEGFQHYPIKSLQNDFVFTAMFASEEKLEEAQNFVRNSSNAILNPAGGAPVGQPIRFYWPEMGFDYKGFVKTFPMGNKKFDYAPTVQITMVLCQDSIYTQSIDFTNVEAWQSVYGDYLDTNAATLVGSGTDDPYFTPPAAPRSPTPAPTPAPAPAPPAPTANGGIIGWFESLF